MSDVSSPYRSSQSDGESSGGAVDSDASSLVSSAPLSLSAASSLSCLMLVSEVDGAVFFESSFSGDGADAGADADVEASSDILIDRDYTIIPPCEVAFSAVLALTRRAKCGSIIVPHR